MKKFSLLTLVALLMLVFSCDKDKNDDVINSDEVGKVVFNLSLANDVQNESKLKSAPGFDQARTVVLSIEKENGDATDYASTKVDMNNMTDDFFSQNLPLGEYKLTECLILDIEDNAIYAIPVAGSSQAQNVGNPLSIGFSVNQGQQTNVPLEIVSTYRSTPADFGLTRFSWTPIITFPLIINVIEKGQAGNFLTASLTVSKDTYSKTEELSANMVNYLTIKDGFDDYTLTITKPGFITYTTKMSRDDLRRYEANPLSIELEREFTFKTVTTRTGKIWMDRNLGATRVATHKNDEEAYGDLYQWGRNSDGHQQRVNSFTNILSSTDTPNHSQFITEEANGYNVIMDWRKPQNDDLWQGVNGINNPCPDGFRIPTKDEWDEEIQTWNAGEDYCDLPLKLTLAGYGTPGDWPWEMCLFGSYWSSTPAIEEAWDPQYHMSYALDINHKKNNRTKVTQRGEGASIRCIKD